MTTDKTLADAKPGGCVQLPTSERERFEAWAESSGEGLSRWPDGLYVRQATQVAWDAWQAALSAQPSPGGQGDALLWEVCAQLESLDCGACIGSDAPMEDLHGRIAAHLAARQPVEVSEGGFRAAASRQTASAESNATAEALIAAARQPVGEIPSEVLSAISGLAHIAKANVPSLADKHVAIIDAWLYAAPPAQAVDLGPMRVLADHAAGRISHANNGLCPDEVEGHDTRDPRCPVCRALIDSQAVGNG